MSKITVFQFESIFSDALPRYIVSAVVSRTINGVTKTIIASSALLTSQQYFAGHIPITTIF